MRRRIVFVSSKNIRNLEFGIPGIGSLIISMTRGVADLLVMYLFAQKVEPGIEAPLFFCLPTSCLAFVPNHRGLGPKKKRGSENFFKRVHSEDGGFGIESLGTAPADQQVMLGYSDSNNGSQGAPMKGTPVWQTALAREFVDPRGLWLRGARG